MDVDDLRTRGLWSVSVISALGRQLWEDPCKLQVSLDYTVTSRLPEL